MSVFARLFNPFPNRLARRQLRIRMFVEVKVFDEKGKLTEIKRRECDSYILQMLDMLYQRMGSVSWGIKGTDGTVRTNAPNNPDFACAQGAGVLGGIEVGTGTTPVALADYCLVSRIAHGTGAGQLQYGAMSHVSPVTVGSTRKWTISRTFTNNSGASITVNEVGLSVSYAATTYYTFHAMIERSLLTFAIANGASATVTYTIQITV